MRGCDLLLGRAGPTVLPAGNRELKTLRKGCVCVRERERERMTVCVCICTMSGV